MAEPESQRQNDGDKLYTLSEISQKTGISMPTLQRYKKTYQGRIPSVGQGRKQRYPESALPVFDEIKNENAGKRGRPRKDASAPRPERPTASKRRPGRPAKSSGAGAAGRRAGGRKTAGAQRGAAKTAGTGRGPGRPPKKSVGAAGGGGGTRAQKGSGNLLTLTQISETTGISYPTLVRYVRMHADRLPHEGKGRARRFYPQAVDVFRQLRSESGRGGRKKGSGAGTGTGRPGRPPGRPAAKGRGRAASASGGSSDFSGAFAQRLKSIERTQQNLEKKLKGLVKNLQNLFR
ncbi:MAG TPA: helix-turn-helix domain-containing protein [Thermoanaerobaculia bacterium]|jgi:predicted DNA-binding transcriptional regulator AlpA|nr:helix-turn-helix domain-containing protein [Thermoanaerobaculia bacterium]